MEKYVINNIYSMAGPASWPARLVYAVEPQIKDPPNRGHNRNSLSTKDTLQGHKCSFSHIVNKF